MTEPIDPEALADLLRASGDDADAVNAAIDAWLERAPALLRAIRRAAAADDDAGLADAARELAGTSRTLGAARLEALASEVEALAGRAAGDAAASRLPLLEAAHGEAAEALAEARDPGPEDG